MMPKRAKVYLWALLLAGVIGAAGWFAGAVRKATSLPGGAVGAAARRTSEAAKAPVAAVVPARNAGRAARPSARREEEDKDKDPFDQPREFAEFDAMKRLPAGATTLPMDLYIAALAHNAGMPRFSSSLGMALPATGGQAAPDNTSVSTWTFLGPGNIGGRVRALLIDPTNTSTMYAGGVAGGVWKTTNGGTSWTSIGGVLPNLAVNSMAMDPQNSSTIYVGTGEGFYNIDAVRGDGIFKTTDGGNTWTALASTNNDTDFYFVNKLVVSPLNSNRVYAATETGILQSTDGGNSWNRILSSTSNNGCFDLAIRTDKSNDYIFASCGTFTQAYIWLNQTADTTPSNWTQAYSSGSNMGLTSLAIAPSNQKHIYALASSTASGNFQYGLQAVFSSLDGGITWNPVYPNSGTNTALGNMLLTNALEAMCGSNSYENQGWYDNVIAVDPGNENVVWAGGIDLYRSNDGGATWGEASYWWTSDSHYSHADQHAIVFLPTDDGNTVFVGSDGGISKTTNRTQAVSTGSSAACSSSGDSVTWTSLNHNIGITQFYDGAVFPNGSAFFGGTQDNGTPKGTLSAGANGWTSLLGGDGGYVAVDPTNTNTLYGENTGLSFQKSTNGGSTWSEKTSGISDSGALFITPFTMDPNNSQTLWIGGTYIWRTTNGASSWTRASTALNGSVTAIAVAPGNSNNVAVGSSNGTIYYTTSGLTNTSSTTWSSATPLSNAYVSWVAYDPNNSNILYATYSTFGTPHVFKSTNGGGAWTSIDGSGANGIPDVPVLSVAVNPANSQMVFLGTDLGVYSTNTGGNDWNVETTGFGNATTDSLTLLNLSGSYYLYAFTHGYGVWSAPILGSSGCTYSLSADVSPPASGATGTVTVTTQSACAWTAVSNETGWLNVTGTGSGSFNWSASANSGAARSGTITVSGGGGTATFTANQAAQTYTISGTVTVSGGGLAGVTMALSGSATRSTTTGAGGGYSFSEAAGGSYTVTPSLGGYSFTPGSQTVNNLSANATANFTATLAPNITVTTVPGGLTVVVDSVSLTAPANVYWTPGTQHTIAVTSPQGSGGTQYVYASWSDGGSQSHSVTAPASGTYTATFATQYLLTTAVSPSGAGTIGASPTSGSGYYTSGTPVQLTATPAAGFVFATWSGGMTGSANPQSITMSAAASVTANFTALSPITVTTSPSGLAVTVDGTGYTSPATFNWTPLGSHTLNVTSPQGSSGVTNTFANWSDGGAQSHTVTAPSSATVYTATFNTQYQLSTSSSPAAGGSIAASPGSSNGYYNSGASVQLTASANSGYQFTNWSGDLSGSANPQSIAMSAVHSVTANFAALTPVTIATSPGGLAISVDNNPLTAPQTFRWLPNSVHTVSVASPQASGTGTRAAFASWSDGGNQTHNITTPASAVTYTANFTPQYLLTTSVSPSGVGAITASPSSADGYYNNGVSVGLTAAVNPGSPGYQFVSWGGDVSGSANPQSVMMTAPHSVTANFATLVQITVASVPAGVSVLVDGNAISTPQTFSWLQGTSHTLNANSPQGSNPRFVYSGWSDGGGASHTVTVGSSGATYTASYTAQYLLTLGANPTAGGTVTANPASSDWYYNSGTSVQLTATANPGYQFTGWSGDLSGNASPQSVTMSAGHTATANFTAFTGVTVTTNPSGLSVIVDGATATAPQTFSWMPGSSHAVNLVSPQGTGGTSYLFANWSDGGGQSHTVTVPATTVTYTATFTTEYLLTTIAAPAAGGTITAVPQASNGFYASGTSVQLTATANPGYQFTGWGGDLTGATNPQNIGMSGVHNVTANFTALSSVTVATVPAGLSVIVDGATAATPQTFQWLPGSSHAFSVTSPQPDGTGTRAAFASWSDNGAPSHSIVVPASAATYTANFGLQYLLTATATPAAGGSVAASPSSTDGYYNAGATVQLNAQAAAGYQLVSWSGDLSGSANPQPLTMNAPHTVQAAFAAPVSISIATVPTGLSVLVDGVATTTESFNWLPGSSHTLGVASPQGTNPRYVFSSWSDNGAATHNITVPATSAAYTATWAAQYLLAMTVSTPSGGGVTASPGAADGYYAAGTSVQLLASAATGFQFTGWAGDLTGTANPQTVTMSAARSVSAAFGAVIPISINSSPSGLQVTVDGATITTPQAFQWLAGSVHSVSAPAQNANGLRGQFVSWSDGGAQSHNITTGAPATYQATYAVQYLLTATAAPAAGGTISVSPLSTDGYYAGGSSVQLTASANAGYQFSSWAGDATGAANPQTVAMNAALNVSADFTSSAAATGLAFYPVTPCRVVDTRNGAGAFGGPIMAAGSTRSFAIPSGACNVPSTAQAYSLNVTVVPQATLGYLTIWPTGQTQPYVSTLNAGGGAVTANASIVPAGNGGAVSVFVTDAAHVILDIDGYFAPPGSAAGGLVFYPLTPCRVVDTRNGAGTFGGPALGAGAARNFPLTSSACGIPAAAQAYSLNMTAVPAGALQYLTAWPTGQAQPLVSTLNAYGGGVAANAAIVPAGTGGSISVFVSDASNLVIDINGYFAPPGASSSTGLHFYAVTPCRVADTRNAAGTFGGPGLAAGGTRTFPVPSSGCGIPGTALAYSFNVTAVPPGPLEYLTIWPAGSAQPYVSTLNAFGGAVTANAATVPAGGSPAGAVSLFASDATQVILDINGYFAP